MCLALGKAAITHRPDLLQCLEGDAEASQEALHSMQCQGM
jgi:hypothetical protein